MSDLLVFGWIGVGGLLVLGAPIVFYAWKKKSRGRFTRRLSMMYLASILAWGASVGLFHKEILEHPSVRALGTQTQQPSERMRLSHSPFSNPLHQDPSQLKAAGHFLKGTKARMKRKYKKAEKQYRKALRLNPENLDVWIELASLKNDMGDRAEGNRLIRKVFAQLNEQIAQQPKNAKAFSQRSQAYKAISKLTEAEADARRATELEPQNSLYAQQLKLIEVLQGVQERTSRSPAKQSQSNQ